MKLARLGASAIFIGFCIAGLYWLCYRPWVCNIVTKTVKIRTLAAWELAQGMPGNWRAAAEARRLLEMISPCLDPCIAQVESYMVVALDARLLGRYDESIALYRAALAYDRRPEIYFNLGITEVAAGQREQGIEDLVIAGRTGSYWNLIEDYSVRTEVMRRLFYVPAPRF